MAIDKVTLQILANHYRAASESMAYTLFRTAYSVFVKETQDFTTLLVTPDGKTFTYSLDIGATWYCGLDMGNLIRAIKDYEEGDICITNDPYHGFVCTHTPDINLWMPIFYEGKLLCFASGFVHHTDVGGTVPASLSRELKEVFQEGIRIPPMKLFKAGTLNEEVLQILLNNVRVPDQNWGDMKAHIAGLKTGERKIKEMAEKFGVETFQKGIEDLLDYSEQQTRSIIREIPDGEYFFSDYIDDDAVSSAPCRLALTMKVQGDEMVLDFTGSDPQLASSFNIPTGGFEHHTLVLVALYLAFRTLDPNLNLNAGVTRPLHCILPEGTVVNPQFPAAVGMRTLTCIRLQDVIAGCLAQAIPEKMPACHSGSCSLMAVSTTDRKTGRRLVATIEPMMGGGGACGVHDGPNGAGGNLSFLENTPVEINEAEIPIEILRYELVPDSGGAGKYRGGLSVILDFQVFSPEDSITARNRDRVKFQAWGVLGGKAGKPSRFMLNPRKENEIDLGNTDFALLAPMDVVSIVSSGGGGWGNPLERPVEAVLLDVRRGFVTRDGARNEYGVVINGDDVDIRATEHLKEEMSAKICLSHFDFGAFREEYENVWSNEMYKVLTHILQTVPVKWKSFVKSKLWKAVEDERSFGPVDPNLLYQKFKDLNESYHLPSIVIAG